MEKYKINPSVYTGVTVLPSVIVQEHLKLAGLLQLKTALYVFSNPAQPVSPEGVAAAIGAKPEDTADALEYWKGCGVLLEENESVQAQTQPEKEKPQEEKVARKQYLQPAPTRLRMDEIVTRMNESEDVRLLLSEAQSYLGRTIGTGDQSSLLLLHDYYGLPVEVILTICEYARSTGKANNMSYIYTVGLDWSRREICSLEQANEELQKLESINSRWGEFCAATGLRASKPTAAQSKYLGIWLDEWHFSMNVVTMAYEEMAKNTAGKVSFPYINKVLAAWHMKGIKTPEDVAAEQKAFNDRKDKAAQDAQAGRNKDKTPTPSEPASYDIERAEQKANTSVPKLVKREKR